MTSKDKFGRKDIARIKVRIKYHFEKFTNNVSQHKLCQSFPGANLDIECFTEVWGRSPSKTECFQIICNFLFEQQNSQTFECLEQLLKEQKHWILKDIFPDADIGEDQVKLCGLEEETKKFDVVPAKEKFEKNEICSADSTQIEKDIPVVERKSVPKSGAGVVASVMKTSKPVTANIADEVTEDKRVNGEQASLCFTEMKRCTKQTMANFIGGLVSWLVHSGLSQSTASMKRVAAFFIICSTILIPYAAMESSVLEICIQPREHIYQIPFCQEMEDESLLVIHTEISSGFCTNIGIDTIFSIFENVELNPKAHGLHRNVAGYDIVNPVCQENENKLILPYINAEDGMNLTGKKGAKTDHNQSTQIDNVERCHTAADGFGRSTFSTHVEKGLEKSKESIHDDISLWFVMNILVQRALSVANISYTYCEDVLNTDYSTAERKQGILGNVNEDMANNKTPDVPEQNIENKASNFRNLEYSSIKDVSMIDGNSWSERDQLLVILLTILLVSLCKARAWEWKKEKRQKGHQSMRRICTGNCRRYSLSSNKPGGKSFLKNGWVWIALSCVAAVCISSTTAASTPSTSKPKIPVVNARVNEYLSISCGGAAHSDFKWMRYFTSGKRPGRLCASGDIRNNTSTLITCLSNGAIIFQSVKVSDMGEYHCIVHYTETNSTEFSYHINVQNSTVNISAVEVDVTHGNIPESKHHGCIAGGVFGGVLAIAAVACLIYFLKKKKWKKRKSGIEQKQSLCTNHVSNHVTNDSQGLNGGASVGNGVHSTSEPDIAIRILDDDHN